jgi:serine/threonine protein kinase
MNPEKVNAGSLKYMAPEVLIGHTESTPKIDVWSLGIILHGLVLGYLPYSSQNKDELKKLILEKDIVINRKEHQISDDCADLIYQMLEKDPSKRIGIAEIFQHPWIAQYKEQKRQREWGFLDDEISEEDLTDKKQGDIEALDTAVILEEDKTTAISQNVLIDDQSFIQQPHSHMQSSAMPF